MGWRADRPVGVAARSVRRPLVEGLRGRIGIMTANVPYAADVDPVAVGCAKRNVPGPVARRYRREWASSRPSHQEL